MTLDVYRGRKTSIQQQQQRTNDAYIIYMNNEQIMMMQLLSGSVAHSFCYKLITPRGCNHNEMNSLTLYT